MLTLSPAGNRTWVFHPRRYSIYVQLSSHSTTLPLWHAIHSKNQSGYIGTLLLISARYNRRHERLLSKWREGLPQYK